MEMPGYCLSTHSRESPRLVGRACTYTLTGIFVRSSPDDGMCITIPLPWLTIDRLRSGRDIRLSTATMRALNPRRPQLTSTYYLFPRFLLYLLLALFVVHGGQARSVQSDEEGLVQPEGKLSAVGNQGEVELTLVKAEDNSAPEQVQEKLLVSQSDGVENEKVKPEEPGNFETKVSQPEVGVQLQEGARSNPEPLTERQLLEISAFLGEIGKKEVTKKEDVLETPVAGDPKVGVSAERDEALNQEDEEASVAKKRRRNDLADASRSQVQDAEGAPVEQVEKVKDEGIRRFDVQVDAEDAVSSQENVAAAEVSNSDGLKRLIDRSSKC